MKRVFIRQHISEPINRIRQTAGALRKALLLLSVCLMALIASGFAGADRNLLRESPDGSTLAESLSFYVTEGSNGEPVAEIDDFVTAEGGHVIALPRHISPANLVIHYKGYIDSASHGTLERTRHRITGDFTAASVHVTCPDGSGTDLAVMQSSLPSLEISLSDSSLADVHADKSVKHDVSQVRLTDPDDSSRNLLIHGDAELKGRGNSSWGHYDKKGYQLKLDSKTSVLGMDPAKKWVLLANAADPTMMRNKLVFDAASGLDFPYVPEGRYADLWINGSYLGTYLITEKAEINGSRLALTSGHGVLVEFDNAFYVEEDRYFGEKFENYFALKDYQADDPTEDFAAFEAKVHALADALTEGAPWEEITALIDPVSFARGFLTAEYFCNLESATTSFYWYMDGPDDVIHVGPLWDYDTCMRDGFVETNRYYVFQNDYYRRLLTYSEFSALLEDIFENECRAPFAASASSMDVLTARLAGSARMNYLRWPTLGTVDAKEHSSYDTYEENINTQKEWLRGRAEDFSVSAVVSLISPYRVSAAYHENPVGATVTLKAKEGTWSVLFRLEIPGGKAVWYKGHQKSGNIWQTEIEAEDIPVSGTYLIGVYPNGSRSNHVAETTFRADLPAPYPTQIKTGVLDAVQ